MDLIADTTLLIGLWRKQDWAVRYAAEHADLVLGIPWIVMGEFRHGAVAAGHDLDEVAAFLAMGIPIIDVGPVIHTYATLCARLGSSGTYRQIGQNDLWIAAVALTCGLPLITRNRRHFGGIEGLELEVLDQ